MDLEQEIKTYEENRERLLVEARGRFVLIKGSEIIGDYGTYGGALFEGYKAYGNEEFLVKEVQGNEVVNSFTRPIPN